MLDPERRMVDASLMALHAALAGVRDLPSLALSAREHHDLVIGLHVARASLDALLCSATLDADRAAAQTLTGQRSLASSIGAESNVDPGVVGAERNLGRWVDGFAEFRQAFADGALTRRHLDALRKAGNPRTHQAMVEAQPYLIEAATNCRWRDFTKALRYWLLAADPDGAEPAEKRKGRRGSILTLADGTVKQINYFDPVTGAAVKVAVETAAEKLWRSDLEAERNDPQFESRTRGQRLADASAELQMAGHHSTGGPGPAPLLHVVMSERVAEDLLTRLADPDGVAEGRYAEVDPDHLPLDPIDVDRRCELADGTPIHPAEAIALLARATLRRLVMGADSEVLDLGRSVRSFPKRLHQAMVAAGRGRCAFDGCDAPLWWLEGDHVIPWSKQGVTSLRNGQLLCGPHNRAKGDRTNPHDPPEVIQRE